YLFLSNSSPTVFVYSSDTSSDDITLIIRNNGDRVELRRVEQRFSQMPEPTPSAMPLVANLLLFCRRREQRC
ncbi:hypothetical protein OAN94_04295, partial [Verrucomicrobiales bacterium]|nr:hypothetical protein [Verrucomicrobiales bacterium]